MCLKCMPNGLTQKWSSVLGVAGGDVAGDALVEAELAEQPERRRRAAACGAGAPPRRSSNVGGMRSFSSAIGTPIATWSEECNGGAPLLRFRPSDQRTQGDEHPAGSLAAASGRHAAPATSTTPAAFVRGSAAIEAPGPRRSGAVRRWPNGLSESGRASSTTSARASSRASSVRGVEPAALAAGARPCVAR